MGHEPHSLFLGARGREEPSLGRHQRGQGKMLSWSRVRLLFQIPTLPLANQVTLGVIDIFMPRFPCQQNEYIDAYPITLLGACDFWKVEMIKYI